MSLRGAINKRPKEVIPLTFEWPITIWKCFGNHNSQWPYHLKMHKECIYMSMVISKSRHGPKLWSFPLYLEPILSWKCCLPPIHNPTPLEVVNRIEPQLQTIIGLRLDLILTNSHQPSPSNLQKFWGYKVKWLASQHILMFQSFEVLNWICF